MRLFRESATYMFPEGSNATLVGLCNCANVAKLPSPEKPAVPFPFLDVDYTIYDIHDSFNPKKFDYQ